MNEHNEFNFESFKREAIKGMQAGKAFNGQKLFYTPIEHFLDNFDGTGHISCHNPAVI